MTLPVTCGAHAVEHHLQHFAVAFRNWILSAAVELHEATGGTGLDGCPSAWFGGGAGRPHAEGYGHVSGSSGRSFDELVDEATSASLEGWDFSFLLGRTEGEPLPWSYEHLAAGLVVAAQRVLDVDTGGGEVFSGLRPPPGSVAVEPYSPNVPVAARRLRPLGVQVVARPTDALPVGDATFDLVLNRHGRLHPTETYRVLAPGGRLLSQQVGARNDVELNEALGLPGPVHAAAPAAVDDLLRDLRSAGFTAPTVREAVVVTRFLDVGAVVFQLRAVPWQAPGFDVVRHREIL